MLKNKKLIVIQGFTRGGTNILWNIIQSHPQVCSAGLETGELFRNDSIKYSGTAMRYLLRFASSTPIGSLLPLSKWVDSFLYDQKMKTLQSEDNKFKTPSEIYTSEEVSNAVLCLKSVDKDMDFIDVFAKIYDEIYFIGLVRNGYALCEGRVRRGRNAEESGKIYRKYCEKMLADAKRFPKYKILKFEDLLQNPVQTAESLFSFLNLAPTTLSHYRLKAKKVKSANNYEPKFGAENRKSWFSASELSSALDAGVNENQINSLSKDVRQSFERETRSLLKEFHYA